MSLVWWFVSVVFVYLFDVVSVMYGVLICFFLQFMIYVTDG